MQKLLLFLLLPVFIKAQSPKDNLLGHYAGIQRVNYDNSTICPATLNIIASSNYPIVNVEDTACSNFNPVYANLQVVDDSTIYEYGVQFTCGRLFSNDSLYLFWDGALGVGIPVEFFGFKQYGFPVSLPIVGQTVSENIELIPQPALDWVSVNCKDCKCAENGSLQIFDMSGKNIKINSYVFLAEGYKIDVSNIEPGIYWLQIPTTNGVGRKKMVVTNR